jgi:hypothetical protein
MRVSGIRDRRVAGVRSFARQARIGFGRRAFASCAQLLSQLTLACFELSPELQQIFGTEARNHRVLHTGMQCSSEAKRVPTEIHSARPDARADFACSHGGMPQ